MQVLTIRSVMTFIFFVIYASSSSVLAEQSLVIAGTGDSQSLLREIAIEFMQQYPDKHIDVPDSIGSGGGIKGLLKGQYVLARTARGLKANEQNGTLVEYAFAISPVVITTNTSDSNVTNLSSAQVVDIYTGKIPRWEKVGGAAAPIYPVDREAGDSSRDVLERHLNGFKEAKSIAKIFYNTQETYEAIANHQHTIGYLPLDLAKVVGLNVLSIDGIKPDKLNIEIGKYPYVSKFYLVSHKDMTPEAKMFIDFIYSEHALNIIKAKGLIPINRNTANQ